MIYRLNDEFTKIEETEGMLENKSVHTPVEIVLTNAVPEKDAGFELQPKEKMPFKVKDGESVYARCTNLDHMGANLNVANFNLPASNGNEAGVGAVFTTLFSGYAIPSKTSTNAVLTLNDDMTNYDFLIFNAKYGNHGITNIAYVPYFSMFSPHSELGGGSYYCNIHRLSNTTVGQNYWSVEGHWNGPDDGIYEIMGLKLK